MFLLYEYDIFWAFLIISSLIPILAFFISGVLAPTREGPEKLSSYESGIEPMGDAWLQFRIRYYMFALVFVVFDFRCIGCIRFYRSFNFRAYPNCWFSLCMAKRSVGMVLAPEYSDNKNKKEEKNDIETVMNSIEFPVLDQTTQNSVISTTSNDLSNWSRLSSLWPLLYGTSCCFIEFASLIGSRFDFDRYGLVPRSSPRQADLILTAGTITMKMEVLSYAETLKGKKQMPTMSVDLTTLPKHTVKDGKPDLVIPQDYFFEGCEIWKYSLIGRLDFKDLDFNEEFINHL
ncbi:hypothetical protein MKX03_029725 [Papaver bracteatum]|nr:hypothetical protein MKX03_029725 [Papaver bracteatum]